MSMTLSDRLADLESPRVNSRTFEGRCHLIDWPSFLLDGTGQARFHRSISVGLGEVGIRVKGFTAGSNPARATETLPRGHSGHTA